MGCNISHHDHDMSVSISVQQQLNYIFFDFLFLALSVVKKCTATVTTFWPPCAQNYKGQTINHRGRGCHMSRSWEEKKASAFYRRKKKQVLVAEGKKASISLPREKKCNLTLAVSPTCPLHKPSAYLLATLSICGLTEDLTCDPGLHRPLRGCHPPGSGQIWWS